MFLFSGVFKESIGLPIDISVFFLGLTVITILWRLIKRPYIKKEGINIGLIMLSLSFIIFVSISINGLTAPSLMKVTKFMGLTIPSILLLTFFVDSKKSIERIFQSISILSVTLSLFSLPAIFGGEELFVGFNDGNYLGLARVTGIGLIILIYFFMSGDKRKKIMTLPAALIVSFVLISTGSRMPIIAMALIALYGILQSFTITNKDILVNKKMMVGLALSGALAMSMPLLYARGYFETTIHRFRVFFEGDGGSSVVSRLVRLDASVQMFSENVFFGGGFGNFGDYYIGTSGVYSHNMFLEFLSELGLAGIIWFLLFLVIVIHRSIFLYKKKNKKIDGLQIALISIFLFFFFNAMVSGDINENRAMFAFSAILIISPNLKENIYEEAKMTKRIKAKRYKLVW